MALKDTTKHLKELLCNIGQDLEKAENGNKAAAQRVRTGTVKLEKLSKVYRKESVHSEKNTKSAKKPAAKKAAAKAPARHAPAAKGKPAPAAKGKTASAKAKSAVAKPRGLSLKRPTAKLPTRRSAW